jgi:hypothetical protein
VLKAVLPLPELSTTVAQGDAPHSGGRISPNSPKSNETGAAETFTVITFAPPAPPATYAASSWSCPEFVTRQEEDGQSEKVSTLSPELVKQGFDDTQENAEVM